jgi:hypothetical protein
MEMEAMCPDPLLSRAAIPPAVCAAEPVMRNTEGYLAVIRVRWVSDDDVEVAV